MQVDKLEERIIPEYKEIKREVYKGIHFFTALFDEYIVLEPVHKEVMNALSESDVDHERLWADSAHSWARNMSIEEQREFLILRARDDIDYLLSMDSIKECRESYTKKMLKLKEKRKILLELSKIGKDLVIEDEKK